MTKNITIITMLFIIFIAIVFIFNTTYVYSMLANWNIYFDEKYDSNVEFGWEESGLMKEQDTVFRISLYPAFYSRQHLFICKDSIMFQKVYESIDLVCQDGRRIKNFQMSSDEWVPNSKLEFVVDSVQSLTIKEIEEITLLYRTLVNIKTQNMKCIRPKKVEYIDGTHMKVESRYRNRINRFDIFLSKYQNNNYNEIQNLFFKFTNKHQIKIAD